MDPIANMLSTIKNASMSRKASVVIPFSMEKEKIAGVLKDGGFLTEVKVFKEKDTVGKSIRLDIAYDNGLPRLTELKRVSKPGRRVYKGYAELRPVVGGLGYMVLSTSRGVMTSHEARKKKLGGKVLCLVY